MDEYLRYGQLVIIQGKYHQPKQENKVSGFISSKG